MSPGPIPALLKATSDDAPAIRQWPAGWQIEKPDVVFDDAYRVRCSCERQDRLSVHRHTDRLLPKINGCRLSKRVQARDPWCIMLSSLYASPPRNGCAAKPNPVCRSCPRARRRRVARANDIGGAGSDILTIYTPGNVPDTFVPGQAKLIKAGSDLVFQMHYTANNKSAASDKTSVGIIFAKEPPKERVLTVALSNDEFVIPPGDANYRVPAKATLPNGGTLLSFFPHMHVRGKAFEYKLTQPGGEEEVLLKRPEL